MNSRARPAPVSPPSLDRLRSERLRFERPRQDDLADWCRLQTDPLVMATLGGVRSDEETAEMLGLALAHWDCHGFGWWMLREPETRELVGRGGLRRLQVGGREEIEIGYALLPGYWGRGLATEVARTSARVGFETLRCTELVAFATPSNRASRRVMEKTGLRYERDIVYAELPHVLYRLRATEWRGESS